MKHLGDRMYFVEERNADLIRAYRRQLVEVRHISMPDIFTRVAESPASRFWVSERRAATVISAMQSGRPMPRMLPNKQDMFKEIYRRYIIKRRMHPHKSVYSLVSEIVNQPAPKFYLTPRTIGEIIYRIKNGWYQR